MLFLQQCVDSEGGGAGRGGPFSFDLIFLMIVSGEITLYGRVIPPEINALGGGEEGVGRG